MPFHSNSLFLSNQFLPITNELPSRSQSAPCFFNSSVHNSDVTNSSDERSFVRKSTEKSSASIFVPIPRKAFCDIEKIQEKITPFFIALQSHQDTFFQLQTTHSLFFRLAIQHIHVKGEFISAEEVLSLDEDRLLQNLFLTYVKSVQKISSTERQKFRRKYVRSHLQKLRNVVELKDTKSVDLSNGIIRYDGLSVKPINASLLLPIKYVFDLRIADAIRQQKYRTNDYLRLLQFMPQNYTDLLSYLYEELLTPELNVKDIEDLKRAIKIGSALDEKVEREFCKHREVKAVSMQCEDVPLLRDVYSIAYHVLSRMNSRLFIKKN